jgi:hypothetical protein
MMERGARQSHVPLCLIAPLNTAAFRLSNFEDITTSFPATGKFTPDQRLVYEAVLDAHQVSHRTGDIRQLWMRYPVTLNTRS